MATLQARTEALIGTSISNTSNLAEYLKDGVMDVTNRILSLRPEELMSFQRVTAEQTSQGANLNGAKITSVVRESGTDNDWRDCRFIPSNLQSMVTDTESIHYASKINPAYSILEDSKVNVYPAPGSNPNAYKIYYINNEALNNSDAALSGSDSEIQFFPNDKVHLVVMYSGIRYLSYLLSLKDADLPNNLVAPSLHTLENDLSFPEPPIAPATSGHSVSFTTTPPSYTEAVLSPDFATVDTKWIETEEDPDISAAKVNLIQTEIAKYQADVQNNVNSFNKEVAEYQAQLQVSIQNSQLDQQDSANDITIYQSDISRYQNEVSKEISRYQSEIQRINTLNSNLLAKYQGDVQDFQVRIQRDQMDYTWMEGRLLKLQEEYNTAFAIIAPKQKEGDQ